MSQPRAGPSKTQRAPSWAAWEGNGTVTQPLVPSSAWVDSNEQLTRSVKGMAYGGAKPGRRWRPRRGRRLDRRLSCANRPKRRGWRRPRRPPNARTRKKQEMVQSQSAGGSSSRKARQSRRHRRRRRRRRRRHHQRRRLRLRRHNSSSSSSSISSSRSTRPPCFATTCEQHWPPMEWQQQQH